MINDTTYLIVRNTDKSFSYIATSYDEKGRPIVPNPETRGYEAIITVNSDFAWVRGFLNAANSHEKLMAMKPGDAPF